MSTMSEQDHLNPRDPLYYAPRWLRDKSGSKSASLQQPHPDTPFSPASFDSQLESAVSDALRHPLDPEVMHEPDLEPRRALWTVAARFAAAVGVSAVVATFFVIAVPASRQPDADSSFNGIVRSMKSALAQSSPKEEAPKPAINEFQSILASAQTSNPATPPGQSGTLLKQFMQWRQKPNPAAP